MKRTLMTAVMLGLTGSAYAAGWSGAAQSSDRFGELAVKVADLKISAAAESGPIIPTISKGYVKSVELVTPIEWVPISGGKFTMGNIRTEQGFEDAKPIHEVAIKTFEMSKTAVTVEQYAECVIKSQCAKPGTGGYCNWGRPGRQLHPVNCVNWEQANQYARFKGARLPSESEWEYAAKSGGRDQKYPWGNDAPTCDKAVTYGNGGYGCAKDGTMPVCSRTAGNTAQGLCDMAGNVWQWVQDKYQDSYRGAPADGSAFEGAGPYRVMRGGSFGHVGAGNLRADSRGNFDSGIRYSLIGFRLARSSR